VDSWNANKINEVQFTYLFIFVYMGNNRTAEKQFEFISKQILVDI